MFEGTTTKSNMSRDQRNFRNQNNGPGDNMKLIIHLVKKHDKYLTARCGENSFNIL